MLQYLVGIFGKAAVEEAVKAVSFSQKRKVLRRAIRDVIEDEVMRFAHETGYPAEVAKEYIKENERYFKREIRARFDAALR